MKQVAFYAYFDNVKGPEDKEQDGHVIVESHPKGWCWYIPVESEGLGEVSVGIISGQEFKEEYSQMGPEAFFESCVDNLPYLQEMLGPDAKRVSKWTRLQTGPTPATEWGAKVSSLRAMQHASSIRCCRRV